MPESPAQEDDRRRNMLDGMTQRSKSFHQTAEARNSAVLVIIIVFPR
jgi:hypothetical protein